MEFRTVGKYIQMYIIYYINVFVNLKNGKERNLKNIFLFFNHTSSYQKTLKLFL